MRSTGKLHLGNYVGALANWVKLQDSGKYECYFFIADWHALTTDYADTSQIKQNSVEVLLDYLAAGLDPKKSTLFIQSHVPQHAELHLLFSMVTPLGWLERVPTYKEQKENIKEKDLGTYGFLGYPVLQSADILIYRAGFVPVGEDQVAHVELTREIARRFNQFYPGRKGVVFPEPQTLLTPSPRLRGTDGRKMSKSYNNHILLSESEADIRQKLKTSVTDPARARRSDPGDPEAPYAFGNMPSHLPNTRPDGGNEVFMDGSASWHKFRTMYYLTSWSGNRIAFMYQDPQDFPFPLGGNNSKYLQMLTPTALGL